MGSLTKVSRAPWHASRQALCALLLLLLLLLTLLPQVLKCATNDDVCTLKVRPHPLHPVPSLHYLRHRHHLLPSSAAAAAARLPTPNSTQRNTNFQFHLTATQATDEADKLTLMFESKEGDR
jgi:hypothetical protein